jgi:hypothetical protein
MRSTVVDRDLRLSVWQRVREFAVPPSMIESASARRAVGDWGAACAAARVDADVDLRTAARIHGRDLVAEIRSDLRHLAPDLLRWHMPRVAPDGLLRPALTVSLARYGPERGRAVHLVARTAPAWADAGQRIALALWDGSHDPRVRHPRPNPDRRFRFDLHRHLWDVRYAADLRERAGAEHWPGRPPDPGGPGAAQPLPDDCAVHRWAAEAELVRAADGAPDVPVTVRIGRRRLALHGATAAPLPVRRRASTYPVLPYAATWVLPDLELLRAGLVTADGLHPLVAAALCPPRAPGDRSPADVADGWRLVDCNGARHRIGLVDGVLAPLDHDPDEVRREELLAALGGPPMPCLAAIGRVHHEPENLADIRFRLDHGDTAGALAVVEDLLGPAALLGDGALRDELRSAAARRVTYGLYRAGLAGRGPLKDLADRRRRTGHDAGSRSHRRAPR